MAATGIAAKTASGADTGSASRSTSHHAAGSGRPGSPCDPGIHDGVGQPAQLAGKGKGRFLTQQPGGVHLHRVTTGSSGVEPHTVKVVADQCRRLAAGCGIQQRHRGRVRPQRVTETDAHSGHRRIGVTAGGTYDGGSVLGADGTGEIETVRMQRPLGHVDVLVPQPRNQVPPIHIDDA